MNEYNIITAKKMFEKGWPVIPLEVGGKIPILKAWVLMAPYTTEEFNLAWRNRPLFANIGIATGKKVTTVDFDAHGDGVNGVTVYNYLKHAYPSAFDGTISVTTPTGGKHEDYQGMMGGKTFARFEINKTIVDVEILRYARQSVAPPSRTIKGDYVYNTDRTHLNTEPDDLPKMPDILMDAIRDYEKATEAQRAAERRETIKTLHLDELKDDDLETIGEYWANRMLEGATEGHRHDRGFSLACNLYYTGLNSSMVEKWVRYYFDHVPGGNREISEQEIDNILRDACRNPAMVNIPWISVNEARRDRRRTKAITERRKALSVLRGRGV